MHVRNPHSLGARKFHIAEKLRGTGSPCPDTHCALCQKFGRTSACVELGSNLDGGIVRDDTVDLFDLGISDGDTTVGPVCLAVQVA